MEPILAALEVESYGGKPVRVEFTKMDGVISHTILLVNGEEKLPVLTSRINTPGQPCFTELHQQDDLLFLTGADGPCHWSMSVQTQQGSAESRIIFDVACRLKEPSVVLSTEYLVHAQGELSVDPYDEGTKVDIANGSHVQIACKHATPTAVPTTLRWSYAVWRMM